MKLTAVLAVNLNIKDMESREKSILAEEQNNDVTLNPAEEKTTENAGVSQQEETKTEDAVQYGSMTKEQLVAALSELVEKPVEDVKDDVAAVKHAFYAIRKNELEKELEAFKEKGNEEAAFVPMSDEQEEKLKELLNRYKERRAERLAAQEAEMQANLEKRRSVLDELDQIIKDADSINKHYQRFQQLQQDFKTAALVPPSEEKSLWKHYQTVTEQFYDLWKINKELRDYDFKKNLEAKEQLCEAAEKLSEDKDVVAAFKKLQELHDKWREIGPVVKEIREDLWKRFKDASTVINKRHQEFFEKRKAEEKDNEAAKIAICEEAEMIDLSALNSFNKWNDATNQIIELQAKWKTLGFASRKVNNELFARFRKVCDDFFAQKAVYFKKVKEESAENLAKKIELCERAEALKDSTDWKKATDEFIELQKQWKAVGPVTRRGGDSVWKRFIAACDYFFENRNKNKVNVHQVEHTNLKAKKAVIEKLKSIDENMPKEDVKQYLKDLSTEFQGIGHVPYKDKDKVYEEYKKALDEAYDKFGVDDSKLRFENYAGSLDELSSDKNRLYKEREKLMRQYEQKRNEIKTYENNLGFFNITSKAGGTVLKEMERRIAKAKEELLMLEKKIELVDDKL